MEENNTNKLTEVEENLNKNITSISPKGNKSSKSVIKMGFNNELNNSNKRKLIPGTYRYISKKKLETVVTEDTLIYDILFDITEEGKKNRNYERVSKEIKKIEQKNEIEKLKLKKKITLISLRIDETNKNINKNKKVEGNEISDAEINLRNKTLEMKELDKDKTFNYYELIQKLKINPEQRTIKDILRIKPYIEKTNLIESLYEEFSDTKVVEKLINFCCIEMTYKKFKEGQIIYQMGDIPKEFYSIIFGKVNLIKAFPEQESMSGFEYFCYLMNLKNKNENYIFRKIIEINSNNYNISENNIDVIHYIYLLNYLKSIKNKESTNISFFHLLELLQLNPEELGLELDQINSINYLINNIKAIKKKLFFVSDQTVQKYSFLDDILIKKNVTIYKNEIFQNLKVNDYFGDDIIQEEHSLTAISDDITEVAVLPIKLYNSEIALLKSIALENKITNLYSSHFFHAIKYNKFRDRYFKLFITEKYYNGDILFKEGEEIKYIYFIQEGSIQLYSTKSINETDDLITLLNKKKNTINLNTNNISRKQTETNLNYSIINSKYDDLVNYLEQKQKNKVLFLTKNEEIGLVSNFIGSDYLTSCIVVSKEAKLYKINVEHINKMLIEDKDCVEEYYQRIENKLNLLIQRLFKNNNIKLLMIDEKINLEKINIKFSDEKKKLINTSKIQGSVNYDLLNNILNQQLTEIPTSNNNNRRDSLKLPFLPKNPQKQERYISPFSRSSNKDNSKDYSENKNNIIKRQFNYIYTEESNKKSKRNNDLAKSRDILLLSLNKKIRTNSGINKKVSKIKLQKNKQKGIDHKIIEKLFITPLQNNTNISTSQNKNKDNKKFMTLSYDYSLKKKKSQINNQIQLTEVEKSHNHPYYEHKMIIKRNRYKIFDNSSNIKKIQVENMKKQIIRLKQLKQIHSIKNNDINYEYLNNNKIFDFNSN